MTVTPGLLLMIIGGSLDGSSPAAGAGMFVGGFFLSILAVACLGPSSYVMDVENGRVLIIRRYCLVRDGGGCWSACRACPVMCLCGCGCGRCSPA